MSSTDPLLLVYLSTGFAIGFGHCIGMCGPLVVSFSISLTGRGVGLPLLLYHCGRILTYTILGGIMGAAGSFTIIASSIESIQKGAMFLAGGLVCLMGRGMTGWVPMGRIFAQGRGPSGLVARGFTRLSRTRHSLVYLPIGLLLGLLPCGPVYTALLGAARAGMESTTLAPGTLAGMGLMLAFGVGTVPALMVVSKLTEIGWLRLRDRIYRAAALLMIGVGAYFIVSAFRH